MDWIINEDNIGIKEIDENSTKVRAILITESNQILIAYYGDVILLPGGKVDKEETNISALIRELYEETGQKYSEEELKYFATLNYFQKDYPKMDGNIQNRLLKTHYYVGKYKSFKLDNQKLTEKEQKSTFRLKLIAIDDLADVILGNQNNNPRNKYFQKELLFILDKFHDSCKNSTVIV